MRLFNVVIDLLELCMYHLFQILKAFVQSFLFQILKAFVQSLNKPKGDSTNYSTLPKE